MPSIPPAYAALAATLFPAVQRKLDIHHDGLASLPAGGFLIAANHVDWLDGFYIGAAVWKMVRRPVHFLAKTNNYWWTSVAVQIPPDNRGAIVNNAIATLRRGRIICNFPEGSRNADQKLLPGRTGTVRMAANANVPIIPVGIRCDFGRSMAQSVRWLFGSGHRITVKFGTPITVSNPGADMSKEWMEQETARLMQAIAPLCDKTV